MDTIYSLFTGALVLAIVIAAFVYMLSPKRGAELLKRLVVLLLAAGFGICVFAEFIRSLSGSGYLLILLLVVAAYFIREARLWRKGNEETRRFGAERTPVMPSAFDKEDE